MRLRRKNQSGAAMMEVAILLSLITVLVIFGLDYLGLSTKKTYCTTGVKGFMADTNGDPSNAAEVKFVLDCVDVLFDCDPLDPACG